MWRLRNLQRTNGFYSNRFLDDLDDSTCRGPATSNHEISEPPGCKEVPETMGINERRVIEHSATLGTQMERNMANYLGYIQVFLDNNRPSYHVCKIWTAM
jgi:hypothetical protein